MCYHWQGWPGVKTHPHFLKSHSNQKTFNLGSLSSVLGTTKFTWVLIEELRQEAGGRKPETWPASHLPLPDSGPPQAVDETVENVMRAGRLQPRTPAQRATCPGLRTARRWIVLCRPIFCSILVHLFLMSSGASGLNTWRSASTVAGGERWENWTSSSLH